MLVNEENTFDTPDSPIFPSNIAFLVYDIFMLLYFTLHGPSFFYCSIWQHFEGSHFIQCIFGKRNCAMYIAKVLALGEQKCSHVYSAEHLLKDQVHIMSNPSLFHQNLLAEWPHFGLVSMVTDIKWLNDLGNCCLKNPRSAQAEEFEH